MKIFILILTVSLSINAFAVDRAKAKSEARELIGKSKSTLSNAINTYNFQEAVPGFVTNQPKEVQYNNGNMQDAATKLANDKDSPEGKASNLVQESIIERPKIDVKSTDEFLQKAYLVQDNPRATVDFLNHHYKDCKEVDSRGDTVTETKTCDIYAETTENKCIVGRIVEVKADHSYKCNNERNYKLKKCHKTLSLKCKNGGECATGGIIPTSVKSDMKWEYSFPILTIGTIADNYWQGNCQSYERVTEFEIKNKSLISEFKIKKVGFDDHILISINNHYPPVYVGPFGGHKLESYTKSFETLSFVGSYKPGYSVKMIDTGSGQHNCELKTSWVRDVDIDLLPYLKEGKNSIFMQVIVSGAGEGWMEISAKQYCCNEWEESWSDTCVGIKP